MKVAKIFLSKGSINEVTSHYVNLIENALIANGFSCIRVNHINQIGFNDIIVTILTFDALKAIVLRRARVIHWFQGIGPEEYALLHEHDKKPIRTKLIVTMLEIIEKYVVKKSTKRIFVSKAMMKHYSNKYQIKISDYATVPCYNTEIISDFGSDRYKKPKFIYVGSSYAWQKLDMTLEIFRSVKELLPSATLSVMTKDIETAQKMITLKSISSATASYAPPGVLDTMMLDFKYAFLIRDNVNVNQVATPTKMANYISAGLIPVYSDVIEDFKDNIDLGDYGLPLSPNLSISEIAKEVAAHHLRTCSIVNIDAIRQKRLQIFSEYYSDAVNVAHLSKYFSDL